ncbi:hypothetical protein ACYJ1Y_10450 [Natrialbaceae archaeon A-gly3]
MMEDTRSKFAETAREQAERQTESAKQELGRTVLDAADEYFPEEVRRRRRRDMARGFLVGLAVGVILREAFR